MPKQVFPPVFLIGCVLIAFFLVAPAQAQTAPAAAEQTYAMKTDFDVRVKMRNGVELSADIYRPDAEGKFPVILSRTPYTKPGSYRTARYFVERGYVFAAMDVRGRGDSDGKFVPYRNDGQDGYDAVEWCAVQPWSTGKVATIGGSYNGRIQWLTAVLQPPHLTTMIVLVTPADAYVEWPTGTQSPMMVSWHHFTAGHVSQSMDAVDWTRIHRHLPLYTMDEAMGRPSPNWKEDLDHPLLDDYWEAIRYQNKCDRVKVPVLHISGWYDDEQISTPLNFIGMTTQGPAEVRDKQKLMMGPWPHAVNSTSRLSDVEFGPSAVIDLNGYWLRWFDYWLKGKETGIMSEPPARIFVMGENKWTDEKEWPIGRTRWTKYYIHSQGRANSLFGDGTLSVTPPAGEPSDSYTNDPEKPVPFITEPSFAQVGSAEDYRPVERRDDVLVYTSEPLAEDLKVCGPIKVELYASSSAKDTDFMGLLIDVWPEGYAQRLIDGMVRARYRDGMDKASLIEPGKVYAYTLDLWNTCQTFKKGHRIRLQIASSAFPKYDRNPQTGDNLARANKLQKADQKIYHDKNHPSHIVLPVVPEK
jgi:putative CocE/NonD family hydrolase